MPMVASPNQQEIDDALAVVLGGMVPAGVPVVLGQENRVPEPVEPNYVIFWLLRRPRLATNVDDYEDTLFSASIVGNLMTVSSVETGTIRVGSLVYGSGLAGGTVTIVAAVSGTGGIGTYTVTPSGNAVEQMMAAGQATFLQETQIDYQVEARGPNSADIAQVLSTLLRDPYAVERFAEQNSSLSPLFTEDPMQLPYTNENQQVQNRWVIQTHLQANIVVSGIPQQFADAVAVDLIDVETL